MAGCFLARAILPKETIESRRKIDVKATNLVANDEETKALLAWLNMINTVVSTSTEIVYKNRGRAIPSVATGTYVKKDGFLVAKSPSNVPSLLGRCQGFAFVLVSN